MARVSSILVIGGGVWALSTLYGVHAIRWFVGRDVADMILGGSDPRQWGTIAYFHLPMIPFTLMLSSSRLFGALCTFVPLLLAQPGHYPIAYGDGKHLSDAIMYPPSPPMILACLPVVRFLYRRGHTRVAKWLVTSRLHEQAAEGANPQGGAVQLPEPERVIVQGGMAAALDGRDQTTVTIDALARLFVGSLIIPPISALAGGALKILSGHNSYLRAFLGVRKEGLISSAANYNFPYLRLFEPTAKTISYADLDPVWWRNAVGLSLFIVVRDAAALWRRFLRVKEKQSRRVVDKPFVKVDYGELDLLPDEL